MWGKQKGNFANGWESISQVYPQMMKSPQWQYILGMCMEHQIMESNAWLSID